MALFESVQRRTLWVFLLVKWDHASCDLGYGGLKHATKARRRWGFLTHTRGVGSVVGSVLVPGG